MNESDELVGTNEAAKIVKTTPGSLARACRRGTIPAIKVGLAWMIRRSDLEAYIARKPRRGSPKIQNEKADDLLSTTEAAKIAGMLHETINKACRRGTLPAVIVGRSWVIKRSDLEVYLANKPKGGRPRKTP